MNPEVVRSVVGIAILVVGLVTLIALLLPGRGQPTDLRRNLIAPWFGTGRWLLPPILIVAGLFMQRARGDGGRWGLALLGVALSLRRAAWARSTARTSPTAAGSDGSSVTGWRG